MTWAGNGGRLGPTLIITLFISFVGSDKARQRCGEYTAFPWGKTAFIDDGGCFFCAADPKEYDEYGAAATPLVGSALSQHCKRMCDADPDCLTFNVANPSIIEPHAFHYGVPSNCCLERIVVNELVVDAIGVEEKDLSLCQMEAMCWRRHERVNMEACKFMFEGQVSPSDNCIRTWPANAYTPEGIDIIIQHVVEDGCDFGGKKYKKKIKQAYQECKADAANETETTLPKYFHHDPDYEYNCTDGYHSFQFLFQPDFFSCETSWLLERIGDTDDEVIDQSTGYAGVYDEPLTKVWCLDEGTYRFTVFDAAGDGLKDFGYFVLSLDGKEISNGKKFEHEAITFFSTESSPGDTAVSNSMADMIQPGDAKPQDEEFFHTSDADGQIIHAPVSVVSERPANELEHVVLIKEHFLDGFGQFTSSSSSYIHYYPFVKGRRGIIRLQGLEGRNYSLYSDDFPVEDAFISIEVIISFYASSMELSDGFCIDYSVNDGDYLTAQCFFAISMNNLWYDDTSVLIDLAPYDDTLSRMSIRFRCETDSLNDDILIDKVEIFGLQDMD